MDVKRIVAFVLLCSSIGMVFFVFYVLLNTTDEDVGEETPTWWRGNSYAGVVVSIDKSHLTLHTHGSSENLDFKIDGNTRFVLWDNTRVEPGVEVKVLFRNIRGGDTSYLLARTVKVLRIDSTSAGSGGPAGSSEANDAAGPKAAPSEEPQPTAPGAPNVSASTAPRAVASAAPSKAAAPAH